MVPGILRDFGDVSDLAAMVAPRSVSILGGTNGSGKPLDAVTLDQHFERAKRVYELLDAPKLLTIDAGR